MSHAKAADERSGHRSLPAVLGGGETGEQVALVAPPLPDRLRRAPADLRRRWDELWTSPVAQILDPVSDLEPMTRLFALYVRERQFDRALGNQLDWLGEDHEGAVFDPQLARVSLSIAGEIRQLEQTLGVTPRGRLVIGAAVIAAGRGGGAEQGGAHDDADD